jgi:ubiquitin-like protein Pup
MSKQATSKTADSPSRTAEQRDSAVPSLSKRGKELDAAIEKVLEDIDDVLEENAEEFVKGYVQRGGQ